MSTVLAGRPQICSNAPQAGGSYRFGLPLAQSAVCTLMELTIQYITQIL